MNGIVAGFAREAEFMNVGKKQFLFHDSYRYYKNRKKANVVHWRCVGYYHNKCRARATTKVINGCERVKINAIHHSHLSESFYSNDF